MHTNESNKINENKRQILLPENRIMLKYFDKISLLFDDQNLTIDSNDIFGLMNYKPICNDEDENISKAIDNCCIIGI